MRQTYVGQSDPYHRLAAMFEQLEERVTPKPATACSTWQMTVDAMDAIVVMIDRAGTVVAANQSACDAALALGMSSIVGSSLQALAPAQPWAAASLFGCRISRRSPHVRADVDDHFGGRIWNVTGCLVGGADARRVLVMTDVTNLVSLEANARQNELMADLGRLVGNVAHEVRNPLFSMSATLDALEARLGAGGAIGRYTTNLRRELHRVTALMQDLLEYGKPPVLDATVENISGPILDAIAAAAPLASARDVVLACDAEEADGPALIDRARIAQAFQNMIENALHYAPGGSTVAVRVARSEVEGDVWLAASVEDSGPGFPEDILPMVFEPFYTTRAGGTGLGLSIVQRIVGMHGGMAFAANRPDGGARVTLCLPLREEH